MRNRATLSPMNLAVRKPMTLAEFLAWEERQEQRYEFDGTRPRRHDRRHSRSRDPSTPISPSRSLADCVANPANSTVAISRFRSRAISIRYPDGMVVCSPVARNAKVVGDPVVIFEVLSPSTTRNDRIVKAREYQATPSVQRYVMLEQDSIDATVHVRSQDGWSVLVLKQDDVLSMPEIGVTLPLAELYEGLTFEDHPVEDNDNDQTPPAA